jgi:ferredoxin
MIQENKKKVIMAILGCASMGSLVGCGGGEDITQNTVNTSDDQDSDSAVEIVKNEKLAVDPQKCIGCGKCTRIAPDNFAMTTGRKAEVISQEIASLAKVDRASQVCPTSAITQ